MKKVLLTFMVMLTGLYSMPSFSQTKEEPQALGLPGDNFNLYAVLEVFQNSKTLEEFEKAINDPAKNINNLDLDRDQNTDYVRVISSKEGKSHTIVLQVAVSKTQVQDVAVIDVNTNGSGKVRVQVIGDEALYGKAYIIEPKNQSAKGTPNPGYTGGDVTVNNNYYYDNDLYDCYGWPIISYMYSPYYVIWISPWYWGFYPPYWHPWRPIPYYTYWGFHYHHYHHHHYHRAPKIHYPVHYSHYKENRRTADDVIRNTRKGNYKETYEGKKYDRPVAPVDRSASTRRSSETRQSMPTTRPATTPTSRPTTTPAPRPATTPSTRPSTGGTRRGI